jgi:hypothetical protein
MPKLARSIVDVGRHVAEKVIRSRLAGIVDVEQIIIAH